MQNMASQHTQLATIKCSTICSNNRKLQNFQYFAKNNMWNKQKISFTLHGLFIRYMLYQLGWEDVLFLALLSFKNETDFAQCGQVLYVFNTVLPCNGRFYDATLASMYPVTCCQHP